MGREKAPNYSTEICARDHVGELPLELIETLPFTEKHPVRHRCAACAYAAGLNEAAADIGGLVAQVRKLTDENERLQLELKQRDP
jgi:hypothetical protein